MTHGKPDIFLKPRRLGRKVGAAIAAVEGLQLTVDQQCMFAEFDRLGLSADERRAIVRETYRPRREPMTEAFVPEGMEHADFTLGTEFITGSGRWRVTDVGQRTVVAIHIDSADEGRFSGPPYMVPEVVFDEDDFGGCTLVVTAAEDKG